MTFSLKRVQAIFIKDWKDLLKNYYILSTVFMPLILAIWYGNMDETAIPATAFSFLINFAIVITGAFVQAALVAEEKEKSTLRGLLLSPATTTEILAGKSVLSAFLTILMVIASVYLSGYEMNNILLFSLLIILSLSIFILIGTILGLVARTVIETSVLGIPVLFIFGMGSMFEAIISNDILLKVIKYLPNTQFSYALDAIGKGHSFSQMSEHFLILLVWLVIALALTITTYNKRRFD